MTISSPTTKEKVSEKPYFFSIIIPAHNEEKYISETLRHVQNLSYPKDFFEVWVIENGSNDTTFEVARKFAMENISVTSHKEKGVSRAKNFGLAKISLKSDWVIFLDADTILEKMFLHNLNEFLRKNADKNFSIGTTSVKPFENRGWYARMWMWIYDMGHKYGKTSLAIQIMNVRLKEKVHFDANLSLAEDLKFIRDLLVFGEWFYFDTDTVLTSVRRFEKFGWIKLCIKWSWDALVWKCKGDTKKEYPVIR